MPKRKSTYRVLVILEVDEVYENHDQIRELSYSQLAEFKTEAEGVEFLTAMAMRHGQDADKPARREYIRTICKDDDCQQDSRFLLFDSADRFLGHYCDLHSDLKLRWLEMQNEPVKRRA